jgi:uncharacterized protein involved in exopolysaccharide biosynthesis
MTTQPSLDHDDEIDLRTIAITLWNARKVIFTATLVAALAAFVVSFWFLPRTYQATAYVFIGQPPVEFSKSSTDSGFKISYLLPDLKAVVALSTAPRLLESVLKDPVVAAAVGDEEISLDEMLTAIDVGKDQLRLQVTDTDPQRAALLANTWAEKIVDVVNSTYGLSIVAQTLDPQVSHSQQDYEQAQTALEDALSQSVVEALKAHLQRNRADLECVLDSSSQITRVLADLTAFEQSLSGMSSESPISLGDGLALTALRQRSLISQPCQLNGLPQPQYQPSNASDFTAQIDSASFGEVTISKALEAATQMRAGLQAQLTRLQSDQSRLEQEIPQLQRDLENAQARLDQLTTKRDQSLELYNDLLKTQQQIATVLTQSSRVASVSVQAVPPDKKSSPKVVVNTAVVGMLGLMLSAFWVLAVNWWRNE